jgi:hypothetical protein
MSLAIEAAVGARPAPARAGTGRLVALGLATATCAALVLLGAVCTLWIGWPEGDELGLLPDELPSHQLTIDHAVLVLAAVLLAAVTGYLVIRLRRSVHEHRGVTLVLGLVLALPAAVLLGGAGSYALVIVESAQAAAADAAIPVPDPTANLSTSPCGYTWTCVESLAKTSQVRLLVPPYVDGWGVGVVDVRQPGRVELFISRGSGTCLLQSSRGPLPTGADDPGTQSTDLVVRGTKGSLRTYGGDTLQFWAVTWSEAGGFYSARCNGATDRATFLASLAVRG